jgi:hypothetical protein
VKITLEIPAVRACNVEGCAYNVDMNCHARAITVGDGVHPGCDTFFGGGDGHTHWGGTAGVGACKVSGCRHNADFECMADGISVGYSGGTVHCMTFQAR